MTESHDVAIIGAGIVGLATARALAVADPGLSIVVLEKEETIAAHQTGRNSGVVHAGLYYEPGSLKARLCVEGGRRLFDYCERHGIPTTRTGKVVVATEARQLPALEELERRAALNGVTTRRVGACEIGEIEPDARGIAGLHVPVTGAVDFTRVAAAFARELAAAGCRIRRSTRVLAARRSRGGDRGAVLVTGSGPVAARLIVNCAGLHVDRVARRLGHEPGLEIVPFRGEYWSLRADTARRVNGHIYPVPDPRFPHLGVHFTRSVDGRVEVGPNAVWAWGREAYGRLSGNLRDAARTLAYDGFRHLARAHWRTAVDEQWRSLNRRVFVSEARRLLPALDVDDLSTWRCGIRAQAVDRDGSLVHDFVVREAPGAIHVLNAPSPAATSCLAIGDHIAAIARRHL